MKSHNENAENPLADTTNRCRRQDIEQGLRLREGEVGKKETHEPYLWCEEAVVTTKSSDDCEYDTPDQVLNNGVATSRRQSTRRASSSLPPKEELDLEISSAVPKKKYKAEPIASSWPSATPYSVWKNAFQSFMIDHGFLGSLLIRGLEEQQHECRKRILSPSSHDNEGNPGDNDRSWLTRRDLDDLRYILITESRAEKLDAVRDMLLGGEQKGAQETAVVMYDQDAGSFGRRVYRVWNTWNRRIMFNVRIQSDRLDWLIAFTHTIHECDEWMYDDPKENDEDNTMPIMVQSVAATWRRLFAKEQIAKADLGWDQQYTKPGVMELLGQFKAKVEEACPAMGPFDFAA